VIFLLVLAVMLFTLRLFTVKTLWWAALVLAVVWVVGKLRPGRAIRERHATKTRAPRVDASPCAPNQRLWR
jgi:hypothetical protein